MKRNKIIILFILILILIVLYNPAITYLTNQAANPSGFVGRTMVKIWGNYFTPLNNWGRSLISFDEADAILHVGFGSGADIKNLKEKNPASIVYGIDISEEALRSGEEWAKDYIESGEVVLSLGDVAYLEFNDSSFDLVIAEQTHIYWEELEKGLSECYRVLNKDGVLLLACEIDKIEYHLSEYTLPEDFRQLLMKTGFAFVEIMEEGNYVAFICRK